MRHGSVGFVGANVGTYLATVIERARVTGRKERGMLWRVRERGEEERAEWKLRMPFPPL